MPPVSTVWPRAVSKSGRMWTDDDFRLISATLKNLQSLLQERPEQIPEYAPVLIQDCEWAQEALRRIIDAVGAMA